MEGEFEWPENEVEYDGSMSEEIATALRLLQEEEDRAIKSFEEFKCTEVLLESVMPKGDKEPSSVRSKEPHLDVNNFRLIPQEEDSLPWTEEDERKAMSPIVVNGETFEPDDPEFCFAGSKRVPHRGSDIKEIPKPLNNALSRSEIIDSTTSVKANLIDRGPPISPSSMNPRVVMAQSLEHARRTLLERQKERTIKVIPYRATCDDSAKNLAMAPLKPRLVYKENGLYMRIQPVSKLDPDLAGPFTEENWKRKLRKQLDYYAQFEITQKDVEDLIDERDREGALNFSRRRETEEEILTKLSYHGREALSIGIQELEERRKSELKKTEVIYPDPPDGVWIAERQDTPPLEEILFYVQKELGWTKVEPIVPCEDPPCEIEELEVLTFGVLGGYEDIYLNLKESQEEESLRLVTERMRGEIPPLNINFPKEGAYFTDEDEMDEGLNFEKRKKINLDSEAKFLFEGIYCPVERKEPIHFRGAGSSLEVYEALQESLSEQQSYCFARYGSYISQLGRNPRSWRWNAGSIGGKLRLVSLIDGKASSVYLSDNRSYHQDSKPLGWFDVTMVINRDELYKGKIPLPGVLEDVVLLYLRDYPLPKKRCFSKKHKKKRKKTLKDNRKVIPLILGEVDSSEDEFLYF